MVDIKNSERKKDLSGRVGRSKAIEAMRNVKDRNVINCVVVEVCAAVWLLSWMQRRRNDSLKECGLTVEETHHLVSSYDVFEFLIYG